MKRIFLEQWLHDRIGRKRETDPDFRAFSGKIGTIPEISGSDVEAYQLFQLKKILGYAYSRSSFYRQLFDEKGVKPDDVQSLRDLARLPFTTPRDMAEHSNRFVCVSHSEISRVTTFTTSGTTGPEKRVFCTKNDLERMTDFMGTGLRTVAGPQDVLQIMLPSGTVNSQTDLLAKGAEKVGIRSVKAGLSIPFDQQVGLIRAHGSTVLFVPTPIIYRMTQEMRARVDLAGLGVKTLFLTVAFVSDSMRKRLRESWNCDVHDHYGLTEMGLGVAVECHAHNGYHFNELDLLLEIVDPDTGQVLDEGEGELVFTTLTREGMPLIRYRTHDLSHWIQEPCPCGASSLARFGKISRRLDSHVRIGKGDAIYFSLFDEYLYSVPEVVDYRIEVGGLGGKDSLTFTVEATRFDQQVEESVRQALSCSSVIRRNLEGGLLAELRISPAAAGAFRPGGRAKKMIVDHRPGQKSHGG
ncbi:MAG: DVU_1553 family AMP-dependent CoA ligase [Thermodesulfobacteriota bacterium]